MVTVGLFCVMALVEGQTISVDLPAMRAEMALQQVGSRAHLSLTTSPQTANDVLLLRFKDVPVDEAMRRIALADDASWKQEGDSYRLVRTSDQQRGEEEKQLKDDTEELSKLIAKKMDALKKLPAWGPDTADQLASKVAAHLKTFNPQNQGGNWYQHASDLGDQAPFGRAITRILASLDPKDLAQLPPKIKTVWSTNPTATQLQMPPQVIPVFNQFLHDNADWAASVEKYRLKAPTFGNSTYWVGNFGDFSSANATSANVSVILLSATSFGGPGTLQLELAAYDSKGKKIAQSQENLMQSDYGELMKPEAPSEPGERRVTLTGDAKLIADSMQARNPTDRKPLSSDLLSRLLDPEHNDPLNMFVGNSLQQVADIKEVNLVAHLSDQMGLASMVAEMQPASVDRFLSALKLMGGQSELKDGWLIVQPKRPVDARTNQADRKELAKYLQRNADPRHIALDERAAFALALPDPQENPLPETLSNLIQPANANEYFDRDMLKIYGLMTPEQKSHMLNGGLPCGSLSDQQRECLNHMVYGMYPNLQYQPPPAERGQQQNYDLFYNGIMHEPTESMPGGIPPKALIKLVQNDASVVVTGDRQMAQYTQPGRTMDAGSLAWQKYGQEHPDLFPWMADDNQRLNLDKLLYGKHVEMTFTFQLTSALSMTQTLEDKDMSTFQAVTLDTLPDAFKKQFQDQYDSYAKSYANLKPGQLGGPARNSNIPPAP